VTVRSAVVPARRRAISLAALMLLATLLPSAPGGAAPTEWIALSPDEGIPGSAFTIEGCGDKPNTMTHFEWWDVDDTYSQSLGSATVDGSGCFVHEATVPGDAAPGEHPVRGAVGTAIFRVPGDPGTLAPTLAIAPSEGPAERTVTITGCGWPARDVVDVVIDPGPSATTLGWDVVPDNGCIAVIGTIPSNATSGTHTVRATGTTPGTQASTSYRVATTAGDTPSAGFGWWVEDRLGLRSGEVTEPAQLNPLNAPLEVVLNGCVSQPAADIVEYRWEIVPIATAGEGTPETPPTRLYPPGCRTTWQAPRGGEYDVTLTVLSSGGKVGTSKKRIQPRDLFVVSLGDSYSSGEGNPDTKGDYWDFNPLTSPDYASWLDLRCHRSRHGWPQQVAQYLEHDHTGLQDAARVSYVGLSCSGAKIVNFPGTSYDGGILEPYLGAVPPCPENANLCAYEPLPSQVDQLRGYIAEAGRAPDLVLVSIGGNDIGFADIIFDCLVFYCESDFNDDLHDVVKDRLRALKDKYARMAKAFDELGIDPATVHLLEYPNATRNEKGELDSCSYPTTTDGDFGWVERNVIYPLSDAIRTATVTHGWQFLEGALEGFREHGICASGSHRWLRDITESLDMQGNELGAFHPNWPGHRALRNIVLPQLRIRPASALGDVTVTARPNGQAARPLASGASFVGGVRVDLTPTSPLVTVRATIDGEEYVSGALIGTDGRAYRPVVLTVRPEVTATATRPALPLPPRRYRFDVFAQAATTGDLLSQVDIDVVYASRRHPQGRIFDGFRGVDLGAYLTEAGARATSSSTEIDVTMTAREHAPGIGPVGSAFPLANGQLLQWTDSGESAAYYREIDRYEITVEAKLGPRTERGILYLALAKDHHTILSQLRLTHRYPVVTGTIDEWWFQYDTGQGRLVQEPQTRRNFAGEVTVDVDIRDHDLILGTPLRLDGSPHEPGTPITEVGKHTLEVWVCINVLRECDAPRAGSTGPIHHVVRATPANDPITFDVLPADAWNAKLAAAGPMPPRPAGCATCVFDAAKGVWVDLAARACPPGVRDPQNCTVWRPDGPVGRFSGPDRIETALRISQQRFDPGAAGAVVLARADLFPDALVGTPLAVKRNAPMLLSFPNQLDVRVVSEIERVLVPGGTVFLLGRESALSSAVAAAVQNAGFAVRRLGGADRYATAVAIARELGNVDEILLATGEKFPDGLAAGAAAGVRNAAVVLTPDGFQVGVTNEYLAEHPAATRYAVGYPAARAYPDAVVVAGADRHTTATAVADRFFPQAQVVGLARSDAFPDALSGGAHVSSLGGPILLTPSWELLPPVRDWIAPRNVVAGLIYGGQAAISETTATQLVDALR
jgi:hypothetical protein